MIDKELSKLKDDIPNINIGDFIVLLFLYILEKRRLFYVRKTRFVQV